MLRLFALLTCVVAAYGAQSADCMLPVQCVGVISERKSYSESCTDGIVLKTEYNTGYCSGDVIVTLGDDCEKCTEYVLLQARSYTSAACTGGAVWEVITGAPLGCSNGTMTDCSSTKVYANADCTGAVTQTTSLSVGDCLWEDEFGYIELTEVECVSAASKSELSFVWLSIAVFLRFVW